MPQDKFKELIGQGAFIEHAQFSGNFYGTSFMAVREIENANRRCLLDIEAQVCTLGGSPSPLSLVLDYTEILMKILSGLNLVARQTSQDIKTLDRPMNLKQMVTVKNLFVRRQRISDSYNLLHDLAVFRGP